MTLNALKKYHNTTLKNAYFDIECSDGDLLNLFIESPQDRFIASAYLQRSFEKDENTPTMFSRIILHKIDGRNALKRVELEIRAVRGTNLRGTDYEIKLIQMHNKYIAYLKKNPVPGSIDAVNRAQ